MGAIIGLGVALAALSDVRIVGQSGSPAAQVTEAHQLQVGEVSPRRIRTWNFHVENVPQCVAIAAPTASALMIKQVIVKWEDRRSTVRIYPNKTCAHGAEVAAVQRPEGGTVVLGFEPGLPIGAGGGFSAESYDQPARADLYFMGYTMPRDAVMTPRPPIKIPG